MLLAVFGPVFNWELVRVGRRRWHWWVRVLYVTLLLVFLYATFGEVTNFSAQQSHQLMAEIGRRFYQAFSYYQLLAVLVLSPIFAATSVTEEKTRQTLPYLLTSQLSDAEIVLAKIGLAVLRVWEILLCGLPMCAMCLLLGGVTPKYMALDFLVAMAAAWAGCALAVLLAIVSRRLSEGLLLVLLVQLIWYVLPVVDWIGRLAFTGFYVPRFLLDMNAFLAIYRGQTAGAVDRWAYAYSLAGTVLCGLSWSLLAWWILRPAWRREEERGSPRSLFRRLRKPRHAESVWDQPWLWRELRSRRFGSVDRVVWALCLVISVSVLAGIAVNWEATVAMMRRGSAMPGAPISLIVAVYGQFLFLALLALPYVAIIGATALAEERDGNHLDLMCITLLDQRDLVHAKAARLLWLGAVIVVLPLVLQVLLQAMGWSTTWGTLLVFAHCISAVPFWLMFGMAMSFRFAKPSHALITSLVTVLTTMIAGPTIVAMFFSDMHPLMFTSTPVHCMMLQIVDNHIEPSVSRNGFEVEELRIFSLTCSAFYLLGAFVLYRWSLRPTAPWIPPHVMYVSYVANFSRSPQSIKEPAEGQVRVPLLPKPSPVQTE